MNNKQITILSALLLSSNLAIGASYDLADEQQNDVTGLNQILPLQDKLDSSFFNTELVGQQVITSKKKTYLDTLNLLKKNQLEEASDKINNLIKQYPQEPEFHNLQGLLETLRKNNDLAIKSYQKSLALNQDNIKAHQGLAMLFIKAGDLSKAKEQANKSLSINDKSIQTYFLLADIAIKENKQQEIENFLLTAQKKIQGNIKQEMVVAKNLVKLYATKKQPEKALLLAQDIIKRYPDNSSALSFLAGAQMFNNKNSQAVQSLEKLIHQEKKDIRHRLLLAKLLLAQPENEKQVLKLLDKVNSISPNNTQVLVQKTVFLIKLKRFSDALNTTKEIKRLAPDSGLAELLQGDIYRVDKKLDQALVAYQQGYKIKQNTKTLNVIVNILIAKGKQTSAINFLNKELKKSPKNLAAHFKLASIYEQQKNTIKTEKHYQAILVESPENALVLNNLAWLYHQKNNPRALAMAEKAYQLAPKSAAVVDTYGTILVKQGDLERGIKVLEIASKQAPTAYDIQYHLANAYALSGNSKQALEILNSIAKSEQKFVEKNAAISLLKKLEKN